MFSTVQEFSDDINNIECLRILPQNNNEIIKFSKKRNPFNHPCVMYKKSSVKAVGSYQDFYLLDYHLWIRMLMNGYKGYNLEDILLNMRAGIICIKEERDLNMYYHKYGCLNI